MRLTARLHGCACAQIEKELRDQLQLYSSKFKDFQETLVSSNSLFATVKKDLEQVRAFSVHTSHWYMFASCSRHVHRVRALVRRVKHGGSCRSRLLSCKRRIIRATWRLSQ